MTRSGAAVRLLGSLSVLLLSARCGQSAPVPAPPPPAERATELRAAGQIALPGLEHRGAAIAAAADHVVVTWTAGTDKETNVYAAVSRDGGGTFAAPVRVNNIAGDARFTGEQAPRVAMGRDVVIVWQARSNGKSAIRIARSSDGGQTFAPATTVHTTGLDGTRGWASLALDHQGTPHVAWLDTRPGDASAPRPARPAAPAATGASTGHVHGSGMSTPQNIFHAAIGPDGIPAETRVATDVCFCCKTTVAVAVDGTIYAAWRHIFPPNFRDMAVAKSTDGGRTFSAPVRLSEDGWAIDGCPEDGPSMQVDAKGTVHVAWPTIDPGRSDRKAIFYTFSADGGRTFAPRLRVDDAGPLTRPAHPQLTIAGSRVLVTWDEDSGDRRYIRVRAFDSGTSAAPPRAHQTLSIEIPAEAAYPAIAPTSRGAIVAWTAIGAPRSAVRLADLKMEN